MLAAVPDLPPTRPWVQVLGRVAVHLAPSETRRLTGSAQRLLSVLVAASQDGATSEKIAEEIWGDEQPNPWRPALRMAVARLRKQLPDGWDVVSDGGVYRITTHDGWIDAWRLSEVASTMAEVSEEDLSWMLAGQPFGDIDLLEMVAASTQHLQMLQIAVAERFCADRPESASTVTCAALASLLRDHPYNDRLAVEVGRALASAGRRTEALAAITNFADTYLSEFGALPNEIAAFLESGGDHVDKSQHEPQLAVVVEALELAKELRPLSEAPFFGRDLELEALRRSRGSLVTGAIGSGKSRLLAALIVEDRTTETSYVVGDDRLDLALGPFAVAMPTLRDELLATAQAGHGDGRDDGSVERATSTRAWRIVLAHLEARSSARPQRLVVDDAHLLDSASLGLLRLLIRSNTSADLIFVVCGRSDHDDADWADFVRDAERAGLDPVVLDGLPIEALEEMVLLTFPDATREARHGLAVDVHEASAGLPAVAGPLIAAADPTTLALPEELAGASALARVTASLSERAPEIVAASAVLGHQFSIGALIALTELSESAIFDVLDELWSTGLIVETDDPDQVRFRHVLVQRAFLEGIPLFRRGQLHRRAAALTGDVHAQADHQALAGALVPADIAAASLRESAQLYSKNQQWRKVARQLRRADELPGEHLDVAALTMWAAALDQSGADGAAPRRRAYAIAVENEDWVGALDAALSGLPEAEKADGDSERIDMLERIPPDGLPVDRRFDHVFHLSRQLSLGGFHDDAIRTADDALLLADDPDEIGLSHVCRWTATRHIEPVPYVFPADVMHQGSIRVQARIAQMNALSEVESGNYERAVQEIARFDTLASDLGDPLRIWQSMGMKSMLQLNDGNFEQAELVAHQALEFTDLHGMQLGTSAYVAQLVHSFDLQGRLDELSASLEPYRVNMSMSLLGRAGLLLCDAARGSDRLAIEARELVTIATTRRAAFSPLISVFLARLVLDLVPDLAEASRRQLMPFGDRPLVAGFGAADLGPTVRYVAQLTSDHEERRDLVDRSIAAADRHGPLLWRVLTRLDQAALGSAESLSEARSLSKGTGLDAVVERRAAQMEL